jgi:hypothetical protein
MSVGDQMFASLRSTFGRTPRALLAPPVLLACALVLAAAAPAATICGNAGGTICCGSQTSLPVRWIYLSTWAVPASGSSTWQYWARRYDLNNVVTYNSERPYGGNWSFDNNGYHGWRGTRIYRSKSASMSYSISQATNYTCFG